MKKKLSIPFGITICLLVGFVSRLTHETAMEVWYPVLDKSALTPPDIVFPIVWGILYVLLGISLGLLYSAKDFPQKKSLLWLFAIQLLLNITWNALFFYLQNPALGLANLLILDILAVMFFIKAKKVKQNAALLFLPYLIWMCFATYLNLYILLNN